MGDASDNIPGVPGIGEKSEKALNEKGIFSYEDLAQIRPIKYYEINDASEFNPNAEKISLEILKTKCI